jgi:hypothetical protein
MEGKKLGVKIMFRSNFAKDYVTLRDDQFVIQPPVLQTGGGGRWQQGDPKMLKFKAGFGIEGYYSAADGDLTATSEGGYFDTKATKIGDYDYQIRMIKEPVFKRDPIKVKVTFVHPSSGSSTSKTFTLYPKKGR